MHRCLLFFSFLLLFHFSNADTIDYWHVYYNNTLLANINQNQEGYKLKLNKGDMKPGDSLSIIYYNDTPCQDCETTLYVQGDNNHTLKLMTGKSTSYRFTISAGELVTLAGGAGPDGLEFHYTQAKWGNWNRILFRLFVH
jgi:hypothetical protein